MAQHGLVDRKPSYHHRLRRIVAADDRDADTFACPNDVCQGGANAGLAVVATVIVQTACVTLRAAMTCK